jgi:hypothetical protein
VKTISSKRRKNIKKILAFLNKEIMPHHLKQKPRRHRRRYDDDTDDDTDDDYYDVHDEFYDFGPLVHRTRVMAATAALPTMYSGGLPTVIGHQVFAPPPVYITAAAPLMVTNLYPSGVGVAGAGGVIVPPAAAAAAFTTIPHAYVMAQL